MQNIRSGELALCYSVYGYGYDFTVSKQSEIVDPKTEFICFVYVCESPVPMEGWVKYGCRGGRLNGGTVKPSFGGLFVYLGSPLLAQVAFEMVEYSAKRTISVTM